MPPPPAARGLIEERTERKKNNNTSCNGLALCVKKLLNSFFTPRDSPLNDL